MVVLSRCCELENSQILEKCGRLSITDCLNMCGECALGKQRQQELPPRSLLFNNVI